MEVMSFRRAIFRSAAVAFLLLAGVELLACDLLAAPACEISRSLSSDGVDGACGGDGCLCCCCHIVVFTPFVLEPAEVTVSVVLFPEPERPSHQRERVYHPPRG